MKVAERADRLIAEYREAYETCNQRPCPPLRYERGWYVMSPGGHYRHEALERMRDLLRKRIEWFAADQPL